ncbi:hypothetical protein [Streptomyces alboflavus]|nr:hypothetical protein [Streptomyces alboflavus]
MDAAAAGAAVLMAVLNEAVRDFQSYGYAQFLAHQDAVRPRYGGIMPPAVEAHLSVGVSFDLVGEEWRGDRREARVDVVVDLRDGVFVVTGEAGADPDPGTATNSGRCCGNCPRWRRGTWTSAWP